jgi:hypothetical protein
MQKLTQVHWLDTTQVEFFQNTINIAAEDFMAVSEECVYRWVKPFDPWMSASNTKWSLRSKNSLETTTIDIGDFNEDKYTRTHIQTGVVSEPGHWTFNSVLLKKGDPTYKASSVTALNTLCPVRGASSLHADQLCTVSRAAMYSLEGTEPSSLGVPLVLPLCSQQDDGSSCGAMSLAYMALTAVGVVDPHATDPADPKAVWNIDIQSGHGLYQWLGTVLEAVDINRIGDPVRRSTAAPGWGWLPLPKFKRMRISQPGTDHPAEDAALVVRSLLVPPLAGHAKEVKSGEYQYKHIRTLKAGKSTINRPGKHVARATVDEVYERCRAEAGVSLLISPEHPLCPFGCGRSTVPGNGDNSTVRMCTVYIS